MRPDPPFQEAARPWLLAGLAPVALLVVAMVLAYPLLPDPMPTHWNGAGEPDAWSAKSPWQFIAYLGLIAALTALLVGLGRADPRRVPVNGVRDPRGLDAAEADEYYAVKGRFLRLVCFKCLCWTNWLLCLLPTLLIATGSAWSMLALALVVPTLVSAFRDTGRLNDWIRRRYPERPAPLR
ncbi:hypothetical protein GCM10022377_09670 [Zhihengliuella alba]|uniref:DUF1648 domain-containing protein n=1 Tax=Zhihengliuella alba TaxID=547018 RepID=A0ABP7CZV6_9MICC